MKIKLLSLIILLSFINILSAARYEPMIGKSGSVMEGGDIRFPFYYEYGEYSEDSDGDTGELNLYHSKFNFGLDFGLGQSTELQNRIDYGKSEGDDFQWLNWTELLKIRLSEKEMGPAFCLGAGARIPVRKSESLGLIAGLFISSKIKDIDFDFNLGINPYLTYADFGNGYKQRPNHYVNVDLLLGYKLLPFLKLNGGFESRQLLTGSEKVQEVDPDDPDKTVWRSNDIDGGSIWDFVIGARLKPHEWPFVFDTGIYARAGSDKGVLPEDKSDWKIKFGIQLFPEGSEAEW